MLIAAKRKHAGSQSINGADIFGIVSIKEATVLIDMLIE
jgi:hypothetical protein